MNRSKWKKYLLYFILLTISLPIIGLYLSLLINSFNPENYFVLIPSEFTLSNWSFLWEEQVMAGYPPIWGVVKNTLYFAAVTTIVQVTISVLVAYVISRWKFKGRGMILKSIITLRGFPAVVLIVAIYFILRALGLLNNLTIVALIKVAIELPFGIWIMKGFFDNVHWDLERAALIDGATRIQALYKVVLPVVKPGIAAISIFAFLAGWGEYIFLTTFISGRGNWTLSVYLNSLLGSGEMFLNYGIIAAVGVFYLLPTLIFFVFTQKYLMKVTLGGVKG